MKALVTGGAGFIGSHLCDQLLDEGMAVAALDDLSTGLEENIEPLKSNTDFEFIKGSVRDPELMDSAVKNCDHVFHLAAAVGVKLIVERPVHTIETNIHGTEVVLETANKYKKKVLIASTSEVYGKNENVPFKEDDDTVLGSTKFSRWAYACSKAVDEFLGFAYHDQFGLEVVSARLFNTIGPRQRGNYGMVVPRFVQKAIKNETIEVYGTGRQCRCFACVKDVAAGLIKLMKNSQTAGQVFNIGSDEEISIEALADIIIEKTGSTAGKKIISYKEAYGREVDDMRRRMPCLEKIKNTVGYKTKYDLSRTLDEIIEYEKSLL